MLVLRVEPERRQSMNLRLTETREGNKEIIQTKIDFIKDSEGVENEVVNLYPDRCFETFEGFGGAITDAAAYVYSLMSEEDKKQLIDTYFTEDKMDYRLVRIHMDSCDFSTEMYEAVSDPEDRELQTFSFARTEKYILPMLEDAQRVAGGKLELMLSPWSPPVYMKTNGSRTHGGHLKPEYADMWADILCRYIEEFCKRGYTVRRMSLQNEAKAVQTWDSCVYSAEQEKEFLEMHLYPALVRHGLEEVEVFIWDHNKERAFERAEEIVKDKAAEMVSGVACHWYSGDHFESLDLLRRFYPELKLIVSESCIEFSKFAAEDGTVNAERLAHELCGDLSHGVTAFYDWNLLLDEKGGPNHVGNYCDAPFLYNTEKQELMPRMIQRYFWHFSHFIHPGAVRIAYSRYTDRFDMTAYRNPDGTKAIVMMNRGEEPVPVVLRIQGEIAAFTLEGHSICTGEIC